MTDLTTSLPRGPFECGPAAFAEAAAAVAGPPAALYRRLLVEQESEATLVAARRVLAAFLPEATGPGEDEELDGHPDGRADGPLDEERVFAELAATRAAIARVAARLRAAPAGTVATVLRQRAPLALIEGCWLDTVSQPATQPAVIVNRLGAEQLELLGGGVVEHTLAGRRRRLLAEHGVELPDLLATDFLAAAQARPLTVVTAVFYLALSRLPASFLPEVVGVHCAFRALGTDAALFGRAGPARLAELAELAELAGLAGPSSPDGVGSRGYDPVPLLAEYLALTELSPTGPADRARLLAAIRLVTRLESAHVAMLDELASWHQDLSPDAEVALIVARHAPYAGRQHHRVRISGVPLDGLLAGPACDAAAFVRQLRSSSYLRPLPTGGCPFTRAIRFGGPMFGIFDAAEARTLERWAAAAAAGEPPGADLAACTAGDEDAAAWQCALASADPGDIVVAEPPALDERQFLYRLVNVERFPGVLAAAHTRVEQVLAQAEGMFELGAAGRHTDATWFDYSPAALRERVESIYWTKLVGPYRPLADIPPRAEVINGQKRFALGNLVDGACTHRIGNTGRFHRPSDRPLFALYADEMGRGDVARNHLTLINQALASMGIHLPHLRSEEFRTQTELPDPSYPYATYQLGLALFPDSRYEEILGYHLGVEMFGLGELRLHETQKMRRHGFDTAYEDVHLSIDNISAGHTRQATDLIVAYLDHVGRTGGPVAVERAWRRVWRGYASFAFFVEPHLARRLLARRAAA
ncbi:iron-containing redox enzyme family protein [Protofrankia sp. BMG5.30]|uniref:iron-containing redox enzyme family protein n=1 Tax=Protofrankia sp. BMG5.30 TaxID=1834514 RepID=UPI00097721C0|nr:iron-containing redox enzyme family protein [Protofrankia sp. BMG5.30]ONH37048.1 hypothetical protein BL254_05180 [Protofrankia sp. BMG5.30]